MSSGIETWTEDAEGWVLGTDASTSPTPAVRGVERGRVGFETELSGPGLATFLGVFSVGLGVAQVLTPRGVSRLIGMEPSRGSDVVMRLAGLREIGHGIGILTNPRSKEWVGSRIVGDVLDLALLGVVLGARSREPERTIAATVAVLGVAALDIYCTEALAESRKVPVEPLPNEPGSHVRQTITIGRPVDEVYRFWRDLENLPRFMRHLASVRELGDGRSLWRAEGPGETEVEWEAEIVDERENEVIAWRSIDAPQVYNAGTVRFRAADGGRGTIVTVDIRYAPPGGRIASAMLKLLRREPGQQIKDDLRRLKQLLETGEVVVSDATAVPGPHPARPRG